MDIGFLKEFEELAEYEIVYISDNIENLDSISNKKKNWS